MFVYQNKTGEICVTFAAGKPVDAPEYIIAVDDVEKKLYTVAADGAKTEITPTNVVEYPEVEEAVATPAAPAIETLDDVDENDETYEPAPHTTADNAGAPAVDDIDNIADESTDAYAPSTEADTTGAPSVEELDDVEENDVPVEDVTEDEAADAE